MRLVILFTKVVVTLFNNIFVFEVRYIRIIILLLRGGKIYLFRFIFDDESPYSPIIIVD